MKFAIAFLSAFVVVASAQHYGVHQAGGYGSGGYGLSGGYASYGGQGSSASYGGHDRRVSRSPQHYGGNSYGPAFDGHSSGNHYSGVHSSGGYSSAGYGGSSNHGYRVARSPQSPPEPISGSQSSSGYIERSSSLSQGRSQEFSHGAPVSHSSRYGYGGSVSHRINRGSSLRQY